MTDPRAFFDRYARAFEDGDVAAIASFFALPALFTRAGVPVEVATAEALQLSVAELLAAHVERDVARIRPAGVVVLETNEAHTVVRVDWQLDRLARPGAPPPEPWRYATTYVVLPDDRIAAALTHGSPF